MGTLKFALTMLRKEADRSLAYILTLMMTVMVSFVFFNIINNQELASRTVARGGMSFQEVTMPISSIIAFLVILFCCFMVGILNSLYLSYKTTQIGVMGISGSSMMKTVFYLFIQLLVMSLIALPLGILLGSLIANGVNAIMCDYLNLQAKAIVIKPRTFSDALVTISVVLGVVLLLDAGYVHTHDVGELLKSEKNARTSISSLYHLPDWIYLVLMVGGYAMLISTPYNAAAYTFPCTVGAVGTAGFVGQVLPHIIEKIKVAYCLNKKRLLVALGSLAVSLKQSFLLIFLYFTSTIAMIALMITQQGRPKEYLTTLLAYIVIILLLFISMLYKYLSLARSRIILFFNLYKLGYLCRELKAIIYQEVAMFYGMLLLMPIIYIGTLLRFYYIHQDLTFKLARLLLGMEIIPALAMMIITAVLYQRIVFVKIKEAVK